MKCRLIHLFQDSEILYFRILVVNSFIPKFLKWTLPYLNLDMSTDANKGFSLKSKTVANIVDPDETAHYELSHLDLHCTGICLGLMG